MSEFANIIERFGLTVPTACYDATPDGLQAYIEEMHGELEPFVSGKEVATPHHPEKAEKIYGTPFLLPGDPLIQAKESAYLTTVDYERFGAIWALIRPFREKDGRAMNVANWYRPRLYNRSVDGSSRSDHRTAHAIDLDIEDKDHQQALLDYLDGFRKDAQLQLSLGRNYKTRVHVGVRSPLGARSW